MSDREVERGSGVAVWRQIGEALAEDIRNKLYQPGEQLPPEPELATRFAVNRHTIRRAMGELELSGLVRIEQGRGTFVQEHAIDYAIGRRTRFSQNLAAQGMRGRTEIIGCQELRAPEIARHLGLARTAPVLHVQMLGRAEARTIDVAEHYFDPKRFPGIDEVLRAQQSVSRALAQFGIADYTRKWSRITAAMPSAPVARLLNQPKTRPVLQVEALNVDIDGAPVQYSVTRFAGDWVQLTVADSD
ncbi:phosphonate metabolism transcriptional regulator PhnF [Cupriavidus oxalaticus]|uniref:Phosphonate metabolism transcriptional regulator PhnF n=1 Tax=Cupriavidus oxalaticus TaxID=96344 RepID=A0A375FY28_9BURK|nr:phosphonate metabolism transcriptional regulator PhnF [Cupriavidus oxalaticus]QRQ86044.1 phosphonate metabolism transcriptional regulator PhnF [Cupriavidus oxalaticus]QRQ95629.1 phosphonate metabolism transcriptional regulator PhnF [Cupriavidus oxalaticus]WQD84291.1 phosphonate metabolism transcriptional regulator PhnF [Cupriavidus oxalaticus]SPC10538.1 Phosphonate operon regulator GntR family PhnF [Cupriavidus oxalaticus]SPC12180.1 Phosphonate operon regulator GntR family PhnF [Cupriavidus